APQNYLELTAAMPARLETAQGDAKLRPTTQALRQPFDPPRDFLWPQLRANACPFAVSVSNRKQCVNNDNGDLMATIRQEDFIQSIADAFQFISYYHPLDYIQALTEAYEREESPAA